MLDNQSEDSASSSPAPSGVKCSKKTKDRVEAICNVLNQSLSQRAEAEKKRFDIEAKLQEEFTGDEDRHFLLYLSSQVKKCQTPLNCKLGQK
jgi:hypothetical protein